MVSYSDEDQSEDMNKKVNYSDRPTKSVSRLFNIGSQHKNRISSNFLNGKWIIAR